MTLHKFFAILSTACGAASLIPGIGVVAIPLGIAAAAAGAASAVTAHTADKVAVANAAVTAAAQAAMQKIPSAHAAFPVVQAILDAANAPDNAG